MERALLLRDEKGNYKARQILGEAKYHEMLASIRNAMESSQTIIRAMEKMKEETFYSDHTSEFSPENMPADITHLIHGFDTVAETINRSIARLENGTVLYSDLTTITSNAKNKGALDALIQEAEQESGQPASGLDFNSHYITITQRGPRHGMFMNDTLKAIGTKKAKEMPEALVKSLKSTATQNPSLLEESDEDAAEFMKKFVQTEFEPSLAHRYSETRTALSAINETQRAKEAAASKGGWLSRVTAVFSTGRKARGASTTPSQKPRIRQ